MKDNKSIQIRRDLLDDFKLYCKKNGFIMQIKMEKILDNFLIKEYKLEKQNSEAKT